MFTSSNPFPNGFLKFTPEGNVLTIELVTKNTIIVPEDLAGIPAVMESVSGLDVRITGRAPVEIYAALGFYACLNGARRIYYAGIPRSVDGVDVHDWQLLFDRETYSKQENAVWCTSSIIENYQLLQIQPALTANHHWSDDVYQNHPIPIPYHSSKTLTLTGSGTVAMYAALGIAAAFHYHPRMAVAVRKPQALSDIYIDPTRCGTVAPPRRNRTAGTVVGILGVPNSGKSVFSHSFNYVFQQFPNPEGVTCFDCDFASRTPLWYRQQLLIDPDSAQKQRAELKQEWTPELQQEVAYRLRILRGSLDVTLADMPGGIFKDKDKPGIPLPDQNRILMMEQCDYFIVLGRTGLDYDVFGLWRDALAKYGLADRIIAEFTSSNPNAEFSVQNFRCDERGIFTADIQGLDRTKDSVSMGTIMKPTLHPLVQKIRYRTLVSEARSAVTKSFLTKEGGVRYGAAVLTTRGNIYSAGQYSSFNHSTNIHAEMGALSIAAANGDPNVLALAVACTDHDTARPCGVCRQVMVEHAQRIGRDFDVIMVAPNGDYEIQTVSQLLPNSWQSHNSSSLSSTYTIDTRIGKLDFSPKEDGADYRPGDYVCYDITEKNRQFIAMVWDSCLTSDKALLKVKYIGQADEWHQVPHSFTQAPKYINFLYEHDLLRRTNAIESACVLRNITSSAQKGSRMIPFPDTAETAVFQSMLSQAGIPASSAWLTGSRGHGLAEASSNYDVVLFVNPEQVAALRHVIRLGIEAQRCSLPTFEANKLLGRLIPGGLGAMVQQERFVDNFQFNGRIFSCLFVPEFMEPVLPNGYDFQRRASFNGRVIDASHSAFKRSVSIVRLDNQRVVRLVSYHRAANALQKGDRIAFQGYLYHHEPLKNNLGIEDTVIQQLVSTDSLIWL